MRSDKYHPFDMLEVKVGVFFALTNLEIVQGLNPVAAVEDQYYTVRIRTPKFNFQLSLSLLLSTYGRSIPGSRRERILSMVQPSLACSTGSLRSRKITSCCSPSSAFPAVVGIAFALLPSKARHH